MIERQMSFELCALAPVCVFPCRSDLYTVQFIYLRTPRGKQGAEGGGRSLDSRLYSVSCGSNEDCLDILSSRVCSTVDFR